MVMSAIVVFRGGRLTVGMVLRILMDMHENREIVMEFFRPWCKM